jgi:hypothetical protein
MGYEQDYCDHEFFSEGEFSHSNKNYFIREYCCGNCGKLEYSVLTVDDGEYIGRISDGSDCTFSSLTDAKNYCGR